MPAPGLAIVHGDVGCGDTGALLCTTCTAPMAVHDTVKFGSPGSTSTVRLGVTRDGRLMFGGMLETDALTSGYGHS